MNSFLPIPQCQQPETEAVRQHLPLHSQHFQTKQMLFISARLNIQRRYCLVLNHRFLDEEVYSDIFQKPKAAVKQARTLALLFN